jgi:hypothetical protein
MNPTITKQVAPRHNRRRDEDEQIQDAIARSERTILLANRTLARLEAVQQEIQEVIAGIEAAASPAVGQVMDPRD